MEQNKPKTPRERFLDVAERRVNAALETISNLSRFSQRSNYVASKTELDAIIKALREEVDRLEDKYNNKGGFKLPDR